MYDKLMYLREKLDKHIVAATKKFPFNDEINEWRSRFNDFFGLSKQEQSHPNTPTQDESPFYPTQWWNENMPVFERSIVLASGGQLTQNASDKDQTTPSSHSDGSHPPMHASADPEIRFHMTPELSKHFNKSPIKTSFQTPNQIIQCPNPLSMVPSQKQKRVTRKPIKLRSPYVPRAVPINMAPTGEVKHLGDWISSCQGEPEYYYNYPLLF